jgi:hypothetical protein
VRYQVLESHGVQQKIKIKLQSHLKDCQDGHSLLTLSCPLGFTLIRRACRYYTHIYICISSRTPPPPPYTHSPPFSFYIVSHIPNCVSFTNLQSSTIIVLFFFNKVENVDAKGQGCNVRCGWRLVEVDGQSCRSGEDLRQAMKHHMLANATTLQNHVPTSPSSSRMFRPSPSSNRGNVGSSMEWPTTASASHTGSSSSQPHHHHHHPTMTTWVFEVPPAHSSGSGPSSAVPFAVLSAQAVVLCGQCDGTCRNGCKHLPKLAFRLDPNAK